MKIDSSAETVLQEKLLAPADPTHLWLHLTLGDVIEGSLRVNTPRSMEKSLEKLPARSYDACEHLLRRNPEPDMSWFDLGENERGFQQ